MKPRRIVVCAFFGVALLLLSDAHAQKLKGAIGIWLFDDGSGETAKDSSGNKNDGKLHGGKWVNGKFGKALQLSGSNEFVEVPDSDSLDLAGDQVSMINWFYWEGTGDAWQTFFSKGPMAGSNENYAHFINSSGYTHFIINSGGARQNTDSTVGMFKSKTWHHAAAVYDGKATNIYLDGKMAGTKAASGKLVPNNNYLGLGFREGSSHYWAGMLDDMAVFNYALSEKEVNDFMTKGIAASLAVQSQGKLASVWATLKQTP